MKQENKASLIAIILLGIVVVATGIYFLNETMSSKTTANSSSSLTLSMTDAELDARIRQGIEDFIYEQQFGAQPVSMTGVEDDDPVLGDPNAPVTIVEFSDYQCPYCQLFHQETYPQIKEQYIETGKVKLVYRDFPLENHPQAIDAAIAAQCVQLIEGDSKYFEMHDQIFIGGPAKLSREDLIGYATTIGIDSTTFEGCLNDNDFEEEVLKDLADGRALGFQGTPSFLINGISLEGAQPFEVFEQIIERELAK
ncbi:hypothetical protein CVV38_03365 [Candidatus Peregrinibacteria bacterium HGW-Peregrinibacteria-1]|jgi:protein-disulfide isomerase|nr:MAG: hypothetical protein CVV38_03365 [Candidatus Peregrinibacteria bacterium HGW-Peregrinibacteria-1]